MKVKNAMDVARARLLLGLTELDGPDEIKRAFRMKVRQCHPDGRGAARDVKLFRELHAAYRLLYSECRIELLNNDVSDMFSDSYESGSGQSMLADSLYTFLDITSEDAFAGSVITINTGDRETVCPRCMGSGLVAETASRICSHCSGRGTREIAWGNEQLEIICGKCNGTGYINPSTCSLCKGRGKIMHSRNVKVSMPRGIRTGVVLKLPGQGPWNSVKRRRGDLYVEINVSMPDGWELRGLDVHAPVTVDIWSVLAGEKIAVQTVDGTVMCRMDADILREQKIVIEGRGWINEDGVRGRHIAMLQLEFPSFPPSENAKLLIEYLRRIWPTGGSALLSLPHFL